MDYAPYLRPSPLPKRAEWEKEAERLAGEIEELAGESPARRGLRALPFA
jgi:hypothetical protein